MEAVFMKKLTKLCTANKNAVLLKDEWNGNMEILDRNREEQPDGKKDLRLCISASGSCARIGISDKQRINTYGGVRQYP